MPSNEREMKARVEELLPQFIKAREEIGKVIVGQKHLIDSLFIGLLAEGHLLIEGVPGLAKTMTVNTLATVVSCPFKRVQFTPDLLPADLTGTMIYNQRDGTFTAKKGPIFTHMLLADEINRAPPKVQAALLEVMQEKQVTIGGETFRLDEPFMVLATQNPIEQEGTYVLPEAQTDRFMLKVIVDYPTLEEEKEIISRMGFMENLPVAQPVLSPEDILGARKVVDDIYVDEKVTHYILDIVFATRYPDRYQVNIEGLLQFGASPRASIYLQLAGKAHAFLHGRGYVTPQDVKDIAYDILRHRLRRSYEAEAEEVSPDDIIDEILRALPVP